MNRCRWLRCTWQSADAVSRPTSSGCTRTPSGTPALRGCWRRGCRRPMSEHCWAGAAPAACWNATHRAERLKERWRRGRECDWSRGRWLATSPPTDLSQSAASCSELRVSLNALTSLSARDITDSIIIGVKPPVSGFVESSQPRRWLILLPALAALAPCCVGASWRRRSLRDGQS